MRDRLLRDGFVILSIVFVGLRLFAIEPWADSVDAFAYWTTRSGDYYAAADTGQIGAYLYSPAFAQLIAPLTWLPLNVSTLRCALSARRSVRTSKSGARTCAGSLDDGPRSSGRAPRLPWQRDGRAPSPATLTKESIASCDCPLARVA